MSVGGVRKTQTRRVPESDVAPVVQRIRLRFAKRGRLRFTSHRDIQRSLERAIRRAGLPIAYSAGFSPHPKISWAGAVPTGAASECEYVEIGLAEHCDVVSVRARLDAALPVGIDVLAAADDVSVPLAELLVASHWRIRLAGVGEEAATVAVEALRAAPQASIRRMTKSGERDIDVRGSLMDVRVVQSEQDERDSLDRPTCTIDLVVATAVPVVRPDDVVAALVDLGLPTAVAPPVSTRLAFGSWDGAQVCALF